MLGDTLVSGFNAGSQAKARRAAQAADDQERPYRISNLKAMIEKIKAEKENLDQTREESKSDFEQRKAFWEKVMGDLGDASDAIDKAAKEPGASAVLDSILNRKPDGMSKYQSAWDPAWAGAAASARAKSEAAAHWQSAEEYGPPYSADSRAQAAMWRDDIGRRDMISTITDLAKKSTTYADFLRKFGLDVPGDLPANGEVSGMPLDALHKSQLEQLLLPTTYHRGISRDGPYGTRYSEGMGLDPYRLLPPQPPEPTTMEELMLQAMRGQLGNGPKKWHL